jgi:SNF2 family DNA or RNA helicase
MLKPLWNDFSYKPHQVVGVEWMLDRETSSPSGGILCDEMGLGKTIQMAGLIKGSTLRRAETTLLVAPVAVLNQWKVVLARAGMTVHVPHPKFPTWKVEGRVRPFGPQVHLIGYELLQRRTDIALFKPWDRIVYDEAHRLADNGGTNYRIAASLLRRSTWLLTATPVVNSIDDIRSLLTLVLQDSSAVSGLKSVEDLSPLLGKYVMARTMDQLRASIPDAPPRPQLNTLSLDFKSEAEAEFYRGMTGMITKRWRALDHDFNPGSGMEKLKLFMRLRQLSLHPQVYIDARKRVLRGLYTRDDWDAPSTKFEEIRRQIEQGKKDATPHKWIIFCHFHKEMELLKEFLETIDGMQKVQTYSGELSAKKKQEVIEATNEPLFRGETEVLLVQLQSGGVGLNLQHFDRIIFTGPWWTAALMEQAIGRAVRIGQREVVQVYHIVLKEEQAMNIDRYMIEKAAAKGQMCREVLSATNTTVQN